YQYRAFETSPSSRWTIPCIHAASGEGSSCTIPCAASQSPAARSSAARRSDSEGLVVFITGVQSCTGFKDRRLGYPDPVRWGMRLASAACLALASLLLPACENLNAVDDTA